MKLQSTILGIITLLSLASTGFAQSDRVYSIPDDSRFNQQNFSQSLFQKISLGGQACKSFGLREVCSYQRKHPFRDAMLITEKKDTASVTATLTPKQPISQEQALSYARTLDRRQEIIFENPKEQSGKITYEGCSFDTGIKTIFLCRAELTLTSGESVSKIVVVHESP